MHLPKSHRVVGLGSVLALLPFCSPVAARLNLPQRALRVELSEEAATALRNHVGSSTESGILPSPVEQVLMAGLPEEFQGTCGEIIGMWGEMAKGTAEWRVRLLSRQAERLWLAFRCGSLVSDYGRYYDERLAVLGLDAARLEFLPLGTDADNDSDLYHVEFAGALPLPGVQAVAFKVSRGNDNPCCDGPEQISEERLTIYADSPHGVRESLSVVTRREHQSHDDVEGDTETVYRAEVSFERDAQDGVTSAVATFREEVNGKLERSGTVRYRWYPTAFRFEEIK